MYDRRIDGKEFVFGNEGALYRNAMTWWDHESGSVWSQVTGEVLFGPLEGTRLRQIPAAIETWAAWRVAHPDTLVLDTGGIGSEPVTTDFVIGVRVGGAATAFDYRYVADRTVVNDAVGPVPIAVYARENRVIRVWSREVGGRVMRFTEVADRLVDPQTGTTWHALTGRGLHGTLSGHDLAPLPWASSYDWAWLEFYPKSRFVPAA